MLKTILFAAILLVIAMGLHFYTYISNPVQSIHEQERVTIPSGATLSGMSRELASRGIIEKPLYWKIYARLAGKANKIKAGEYQLKPGVSPAGLLDLFVSGRTVQYSITIPEGWTFKQMLAAIAEHDRIKKTLTDTDVKKIMAQLDHPDEHPEGRFLPETYFFSGNTADIEILERSYQALSKVLQREWAGREEDLPLNSEYEALILASVVEKETAVADEREMIAAVFVNRLRKGMKLQTDPTVIYGMGDAYKGNIRKKDLLKDTPYNTYTRKGLPPTPIALPSASSIKAVLHPAETEALFFVASGGGRHHFTNTYEEHREAVIKYLLGGNASRYKGDQ
jgi:UPF0755 protein